MIRYRLIQYMLGLVVTLASLVSHAAGTPPQTLTFMSYNIHHGADIDEEPRLEEMTSLVRALNPDFIALQEVDSVVVRSGMEDQARYIAERNGMYHVFFKHFKMGDGSYGNAILSKYPMFNMQDHRLPVVGKEDGVTFMTVDVDVEGQVIRIANVHMDYRAENSRIRQAHRIRDILKQSEYPVVLMGDFNARPNSVELHILTQGLRVSNDLRSATFPAHDPKNVIDYILYSQPFKQVHSYTYPTLASDHLPVISVLRL